MSEVTYDEWMSDADTVMWDIELDPLLRSTITGVIFLDGTPDRDEMDAAVDRIVASIPRMTQHVEVPTGRVANPRWVTDQRFDLSYHYRWTRLPGKRPTRRKALDQAQVIAAQAFDKDRPLWELTVVEGLSKQRSVLVMKVHHAITDGVGMVRMLQHMVDLEPAPDRSGQQPPRPLVEMARRSRIPVPGAAPFVRRASTEARAGAQFAKATTGALTSLVTSPVETTGAATKLVGSLARVLKPATEPLSPLMAGRSMSPRFESVVRPLDDLKATGREIGGSLNDVFVAAVLGGVDDYHSEFGIECESVRFHMPVSIRGGDAESQSSNQFAPARMEVQLSAKLPLERLEAARSVAATMRSEPALRLVGELSGAITRLGPWASKAVIGSMMKGVDVTASNVPGPPFPVWIAGRRITEFYAFGPLAGAGVNVTLFSYDGDVTLAINADAAAVPDPATLRKCIERNLDDLIALAAPDD